MRTERFWNYIAEADPAEPLLPPFHTTRGIEFRGIAERSLLLPQEKQGKQDPFPNERLIYFFYGRPAFRDDAKRDTSRAMLMPVALILRPEAITKVKRAFPFDTGAAHNNLYEAHISKPLDWRDLELGNTASAPARVVSRFFGSNENYVFGQRREGLNFAAMNFEVHGYYELVADKNCRADDRRFTAELQVEVEHGMELSADTVLAVCLPNIFLEDAEIRETVLGRWKAVPLPYLTYGGRVGECYKSIFDLTIGYMKDEGFLQPPRSP